MSYKKILPVLAGLVAVLFMYQSVRAAFLILTRIGTLSTSGQIYSSWTYTGATAPDFAGTATPGAMVAITVNAITSTTSAGVNGAWLAAPTNIVPGTNSVSIASGNEVVAFSLVFSQAASPTATPIPTPTATPSDLPEAGVMIWPLGLVAAGLVVFFAGRSARDKVEEHYGASLFEVK